MILLIFGSFLILLFLGLPVAFSMGVVTAAFFILQDYSLEQIVQRMAAGVDSFPLLCLPFFLLAGDIMGRGGITKRLMRLVNCIVGGVTGGIAMTSVVTCALFGTISGSAPATAFAIGSVVVPEMKRQGYGNGFIASLLGGAGTLGLIIPPSLVMVLLGVTGGISIGRLFLGGFLPGAVMTIFLCVFSYVIVRSRGYGRSVQRNKITFQEFMDALVDALLPLTTPLIILGGIFSGIMTPTEASVVAVIYAILLSGFIYHELALKTFFQTLSDTAVVSASIVFIISVASALSWVLTVEGIPNQLSEFFLNYARSPFTFLIMISGVIFILGCFTEVISLIILLTPLFLPIALKYGIDPIHFGLVMTLNFCVAGVTPPVGLSLFAGIRVTSTELAIEDTFPDVYYIVTAMCLATLIIIYYPSISVFLPNLLMKAASG